MYILLKNNLAVKRQLRRPCERSDDVTRMIKNIEALDGYSDCREPDRDNWRNGCLTGCS